MNESRYWENKWAGRSLKPANNFARRAYPLIKARRLKTLLDLGCGDGRDSIYFFRKGIAVTAVDFSKSGIKKLKALNQKIECVLKDIKKIDFADDCFDVIYAHLGLQYFSDKTTSEIFDNLFRILKKGGLIFVKCKSADDTLFGKGKKIGENIYKRGHYRHFFTKKYMAENLKSFKIIRIRKTLSVYDGYKSAFIEAVAEK